MPTSSFKNIAILASGSGTNAEAIMDYFQHHHSVRVKLVLSNKPQAQVLERAAKFSVSTVVFSREEFLNELWLLQKLEENDITHLVLAGFLWLVPPYLVKAFSGRIVNIHPALLPKFGGKGMYGQKVHEAVKQAGEKETGITIHQVNEHYDEGVILFQANCDVEPSDSAEAISKKVQQLEHRYYPEIIEKWILLAD